MPPALAVMRMCDIPERLQGRPVLHLAGLVLVAVQGLEDFQRHVGGYVEALSSDDGDHTIWLNEEGKIAGLPVNSKGHRIVHELTILAPDDVIVGPVLITGDLADDGETYLPPTKALRERLGLDD